MKQTSDEMIDAIESLLTRNSEIECERSQNLAAIELLKIRLANMQLKIDSPLKPTRKSRTQRFIDANDLTDQEIEFISKTGRNTLEVGEFLGVHRNQASAALRSGQFKTASNDMKGKRMIDTISVLESRFGRGAT